MTMVMIKTQKESELDNIYCDNYILSTLINSACKINPETNFNQ